MSRQCPRSDSNSQAHHQSPPPTSTTNHIDIPHHEWAGIECIPNMGLPSINTLVEGLPAFSCRGCCKVYARSTERDTHQVFCLQIEDSPEAAYHGTAGRPPGPALSLYGSYASSTISGSESSDASPIISGLSAEEGRATIANTNNNSGIGKGMSRHPVLRPGSMPPSDSLSPDGPDRDVEAGLRLKRARKNDQGKRSRKRHAEYFQIQEDLFENYLELRPARVLSRWNKNAAGIETHKSDHYRRSHNLLKHLLDQSFQKALAGNDLTNWRSRMRQIANADNSLTHGTWLENADGSPFEPCVHSIFEQRCSRHGHSNHIHCRKDRLKQNFRCRMNAYRAQPAARDDSTGQRGKQQGAYTRG